MVNVFNSAEYMLYKICFLLIYCEYYLDEVNNFIHWKSMEQFYPKKCLKNSTIIVSTSAVFPLVPQDENNRKLDDADFGAFNVWSLTFFIVAPFTRMLANEEKKKCKLQENFFCRCPIIKQTCQYCPRINFQHFTNAHKFFS